MSLFPGETGFQAYVDLEQRCAKVLLGKISNTDIVLKIFEFYLLGIWGINFEFKKKTKTLF